jgi:hypothetical protein
MDNEFLSIVEKLAILEGRIAPKESKAIVETSTKQKKPALFNNLKKDESAMPMVGGVEFAEDKMEEDVLGRVKASLADYLKSAEENLKHDTDLIAKKKQDLDLKKKELKDLTLQAKQGVKEAIPMTLEDHQKLEVGDRIMVTGPNHYQGEFGDIVDFGRGSDFIIVDINGEIVSMHASDVEYHDDQEDVEDWDEDDGVMFEPPKNKNHSIYKNEDEIDEDPNQTPAGGEAPAGLTDPTYAESMTAPVKTVNVPTEEVGLSGGGGSVLVEIHGDERDGFCIKRAGKELPTRFKSLEECEIALEMYMARAKAKQAAEQSADYIEEK